MVEGTECSGETTELISIYTKLDDNFVVKELLVETIPGLKFQHNDMLPKKICINCTEALKEIYQFQQNCLKNEAKLHEIISIKHEKTNNPAVIIVNDTDYIEEIITKIDAEDSSQNSQYVLEKLKEETETEAIEIDFVESCSEDGLDNAEMGLSNENDQGNQINIKRIVANKSCRNESKNKAKNNQHKSVKHAANSPTKKSTMSEDSDLLSDVEDIIESDDSLDLEESDAGDNFDAKKRRKRKKILKDDNHQKPAAKKSTKRVLYSCSKCEKQLKSETALAKHLEMHRKLVCNVCEEGMEISVKSFIL